MNDERVFSVQRFDSADPTVTAHGCHQVCLTLNDDGSFMLLISASSAASAQQEETIELYRGVYEDQTAGVVCRATRRERRHRMHDDAGGHPDEDVKLEEPVDARIAFKRNGASALVCPIDHDGLLGVLMSAHLAPHPSLFAGRV
ncbi:MAG: hypothetical protein U0359_08950 [Byssovorax sp.]